MPRKKQKQKPRKQKKQAGNSGKNLKSKKNLSPLEKLIRSVRNNDPEIKDLDFTQKSLSNNMLFEITDALIKNTHVLCLKLIGHKLSPEGIDNLSRNRSIQEIDFTHSPLRSTGVTSLFNKYFSQNKSIQTLNMNGCAIRNSGLKHLSKKLNETSISTLSLARNDFDSLGISKLCLNLKKNTLLQCLNLNYNKIDDKSIKALGEALAKNTSLKALSLDNAHIKGEIISELAKGVTKNTALYMIYLNGNNLGDIGTSTIAEALTENDTLKVLQLNSNGIEQTGASELGEGLARNHSLARLCLAANKINDAGVKKLFEGVRKNTTLFEIDLVANKITDEGARAILDILESHETLLFIDLIGNEINPKLIEQIDQCLEKNRQQTYDDAQKENPDVQLRLAYMFKKVEIVDGRILNKPLDAIDLYKRVAMQEESSPAQKETAIQWLKYMSVAWWELKKNELQTACEALKVYHHTLAASTASFQLEAKKESDIEEKLDIIPDPSHATSNSLVDNLCVDFSSDEELNIPDPSLVNQRYVVPELIRKIQKGLLTEEGNPYPPDF